MTASKAAINSQSGNRLDVLELRRIPTRQITTTPVDILNTDINTELVSNIGVSQVVVVSDELDTASGVGDKVSLIQFGEGVPSISVSGSQVINGATTNIPISARYQGVVITKIDDGAWTVSGAV